MKKLFEEIYSQVSQIFTKDENGRVNYPVQGPFFRVLDEEAEYISARWERASSIMECGVEAFLRIYSCFTHKPLVEEMENLSFKVDSGGFLTTCFLFVSKRSNKLIVEIQDVRDKDSEGLSTLKQDALEAIKKFDGQLVDSEELQKVYEIKADISTLDFIEELL